MQPDVNKVTNDKSRDEDNRNNQTQNSLTPLNQTVPEPGTEVYDGKKEERKTAQPSTAPNEAAGPAQKTDPS